jgi:formate-dependent nitrite reductase membrane component NrfD
MKMRHDMVTGIVGLLTCIFFFIMTQQVRQPANLLEPGPRLLPYVAIFLIGISSIALIVKGYKEREIAEKPYFPKGGVIKVTKSFLMLVIYAVAMTYLGFVITTPFATAAFIYDLKGNSEVRPVSTVIISVVVTAVLYAMFVFAFQIKLPAGVLFGG